MKGRFLILLGGRESHRQLVYSYHRDLYRKGGFRSGINLSSNIHRFALIYPPSPPFSKPQAHGHRRIRKPPHPFFGKELKGSRLNKNDFSRRTDKLANCYFY